jgi:hypothetical protein
VDVHGGLPSIVTRCPQDFDLCKSQLIERGEQFAETSLSSRKRITEVGHNFIRDGMVRLTTRSLEVVGAIE